MMKTYKILLTFFLILMSGVGFSQTVPSYVPTSGLVGWWGFNGNAQDGSGNGNHGTVNGATLTIDRFGNSNNAYNFISTNNNYISVNNNPVQNGIATISGWFNASNPIGGPIFHIGADNSTQVNCNGYFFGFGTLANPSGNTLLIDASCQRNYSTGWNAIANVWYHFILVRNQNNLTAYINGNLLGSYTPNSINPPSNSIFFGSTFFSNSVFYNGKIDDIGIWNRALTQQEITNLYNSQIPTQTSLCLPTITTSSPSSVGVDSVVIGGDISNDGGSSIVLRGICFSTTPNPNMGNQRTEDGSGIGSFNTIMRGLTSSMTYYARSYAKNSNGVVAYGNEVSFTTGSVAPSFVCGSSTVSDVDNNTYNTVQIGTQCWTQSNLKTSKFRNGDNIPTGLSNSAWLNTTSGAYAIYNNDPVNDGLYGKLYNHNAVTDSRGLCPTGWHVPSDGEWTTLVNHLGGSSVAGGSLKSTAMQPTPGGWNPPNTGATNSSGFTALPGGLRGNGGDFDGMSSGGWWWSSVLSGSFAWRRRLNNDVSTISRLTSPRTTGYSVRCCRD